MNDPDIESDAADDKITRFYRNVEEDSETATDAEEQKGGDSEEKTEAVSDAERQTNGDGEDIAHKKPARKRGIERHLYPCPHCGELILDHFTECPKCGGKVQPRGYHVDEEKRKKIMRVFRIVGIVLSIGAVALFIVLANK